MKIFTSTLVVILYCPEDNATDYDKAFGRYGMKANYGD
jgi:hypothetical protein